MNYPPSAISMKQKTLFFTVTNDLVFDQRMIRICTALSDEGYSVRLIGRLRKNSLPPEAVSYTQKRIRCFFDRGKLFYLEYNFRLFWLLLFSKFDAVCCIDLDTLVAGFAASRIKGKVCVYDAHEYFTEVPEVIGRPAVKATWELVGRVIVPRLKYCYTVCESLAEVLSEKYKTRFEVIRNVPFKSADSVFHEKHLPPIVLYQGALNAGRGLEQTIEAMLAVDGAELWLAGEGDLSAKLRQLVLSKKLEHKVIFKGYLRPAELRHTTARATIGLNLLDNTSLNYYYSLANKTFDYIQAAVPAIHMDFPEYRRINSTFEVACLIDDLNPETIADTINKLLENKELYGRLVENCKQARAVFVWETEKTKLLDFYRRLFKTESVR